ncbi:UrcA family protein [Sphingomicrobium flavum]|uniref:UrcA family protein n=1 Tax=Sphingomicrobium flavum TaxID=1229164 RepID=UPI0021AD8A7D|nr:UrcA family protein [Sphingomicrobium flavum]
MKTMVIAAVATCLMSGAIAAPLYAQDGSDVVQRTVEIDVSDLDLSTASGKQVLLARVNRAVRKVCPNRVEGPVKKYPDPKRCSALSWQNAERQIERIEARLGEGDDEPNRLAVATVTDESLRD